MIDELIQIVAQKIPDIMAILCYVVVFLKMYKEQELSAQNLMSYISVDREKLVQDFSAQMAKTLEGFETERKELTEALEQAKQDAEESITTNAEQIAVLTTQMSELLEDNRELKAKLNKAMTMVDGVVRYDKEV